MKSHSDRKEKIMRKIKYITIIFSLICVFSVLSGCGSDAVISSEKFDPDFEKKKASDFTAAENESYSLEWDGTNKRILLKEKLGERVWSNVPTEALSEVIDEDGEVKANNPMLEAPILIEYIDPETMNLKIVNGYTGSLKKNNYSIEKSENGFTIIYYFKKEEISVPVNYTLNKDYIEVTVDPLKITENANKIYSISVAPFFCGIKNNSGGYLFIPSGSGALIYADDSLSATRSYSAPVYGRDLEVYPENQIKYSVEESVYLPVFGSADTAGGTGVCGIITSGEGAASVELNYGNSQIGFSSVYPKFALRGYQNATALLTTWKTESRIYSDDLMKSKAAVRFYPLYGENASVTGMAEVYRNYLIDKYGMKKSDIDSSLNIKILGGSEIKKSVLGIPYSTMYAATTTEQAGEILTDILKTTGVTPVIQLTGYGESGTDIKKIAGNYTVNKAFGGENGLKTLCGVCTKYETPMFFDFDLIAFSNSGKGFSTLFDAATAVNKRTTLQYVYNIGTKSAETALDPYKLIKRSLIQKSAEKALDAADRMSLQGISVGRLAYSAYSDYGKQEYYCKGGIADDVNKLLKKFTSNGKRILANSANDYAATEASVIFDTPTTSSKEIIFDCDIPFYQLVFKGYKAMSSSSLNLSPDQNDLLLRCAETGIGLQYTVAANYSVKLKSNTETDFYASVYGDIKDNIKADLKEYDDYRKSVADAKIIDYRIINKKVRKTTFDNGIAVIVNHGNESCFTDGIEIPAKSYKVITGA